jgi:hypothetical protein
MLSFDEWKHDKLVEFAKLSTEYRVNRDEKKRKYYYYNKTSGTSQWVKPPVIAEYEKVLLKEYNSTFNVVYNQVDKPELSSDKVSIAEEELSTNKKQKLTQNSSTDLPVETHAQILDLKPPDSIENIHARQLADENDMKRIEAVLAQKDAIMEPDVAQQVKALVQTHKQPPATVVRSLVGTYTGYAQMSRIVLEWIALAEELSEPQATTKKQGDISFKSEIAHVVERGAVDEKSAISAHPPLLPAQEETVVALVAQLIRQRFNRSLVDELVLQFRATPLWLAELMRDDTFRVVLMDLHIANPSSSFLGLCMREIEKMNVVN